MHGYNMVEPQTYYPYKLINILHCEKRWPYSPTASGSYGRLGDWHTKYR